MQSSSPAFCAVSSVQPSQSTQSSTLVTLLQPIVHSSLRITNRSFRHPGRSCHLWKKLPPTLRVPCQSAWCIITNHHPAVVNILWRFLFSSWNLLLFLFSQILSLHSHLSLTQTHLLKFDYTMFGATSGWWVQQIKPAQLAFGCTIT